MLSTMQVPSGLWQSLLQLLLLKNVIFSSNVFAAIIMLLSAIVFSAAFIGMVFALIKVHRLYRGAGFSFDKARKEFSDGVMSDRNVQQVLLFFSFRQRTLNNVYH